MKQLKKQLLALGLAAALTAVLPLAGVSAWGPERPMYTNAEPADHATFNSIIDNPVFGDERDFVRIVEKDAGETYSSDITVEPGKQYEVIILYHNNFKFYWIITTIFGTTFCIICHGRFY